ncbi:MAG TPA: DUF167 domain-containing protein [Nitrospiria bacterium]|nr:DUF167 domain-containing protein [Nitrospiria bacterium]
MPHPFPPSDPNASIDIREDKDSLTFPVIVQPRASKNGIVGIHGKALKIRMTAPPVDGEANSACMAFLSKTLGVPKNHIEIIQGAGSRKKTIRVTGMEPKTLLSRLGL